jgi:PAS domain S-box-containing protein
MTASPRPPDVVQQRYRDLFELVPDPYVLTDGRGVIREANHAAEAMFGVPRRSLLGKPLAVYVCDLDSVLDELRRHGRIPEVELQVRPRRGSPIDAGVTAAAVYEDAGEATGLHWILRDVSERKRAEYEIRALNSELEERVKKRTKQLQTLARAQNEVLRELAAERSRLEAVLQQLPGGVILAEAPSGKFILANDQAERLLGMPILEAATIADYRRHHGLHTDGRRYEPDEWPLARSVTTGEVVHAERIEFVRDDGRRILLDVSSAPIHDDDDGEIVAGVVTFYDVGERERRARVEREFVTNAAHELRTPLAAIASAVEVLQGGAKERPEHRDRFLAHVEEQSGRLQRLVHSLLVLARAQMGEEPALLEPVELAPLLVEIAGALEPRGGFPIVVDCPDGITALANPYLLEQAVANVGSNAARYGERGEIVLAARAAGDGEVAIEVVDSGPGLSGEEGKRVFDRFYRGAEANDSGFGLGMAISAQAVEAMRGRIEVDSAPGKGTTVRIVLTAAGPVA